MTSWSGNSKVQGERAEREIPCDCAEVEGLKKEQNRVRDKSTSQKQDLMAEVHRRSMFHLGVKGH